MWRKLSLVLPLPFGPMVDGSHILRPHCYQPKLSRPWPTVLKIFPCGHKKQSTLADWSTNHLLPTGFCIFDTTFQICLTPMQLDDQLITDEPIEFEKQPVEVQDCRKITNHFRGIYRRKYPNLIRPNRRMSTCNHQLDLQPLGISTGYAQ